MSSRKLTNPSPRIKDLAGQKFGLLTVIAQAPHSLKKPRTRWMCQCECGNTTVVTGTNLRPGRNTGCGCQRGKNRLIDLQGQRFGRLLVLRRTDVSLSGRVTWECLCDCGNTSLVIGGSLRRGFTESCGCLREEATRQRRKTHGMTHSRTYRAYYQMRERCLNPHHDSFQYYGGRGIRVEWESFESFLADMGPAPGPSYSIDRKNGALNYCKDNCRWATRKEQMNNMSSNRLITYNGKTLTVAQWAEETGLSYSCLMGRLQSNMTLDKVFYPLPYRTKRLITYNGKTLTLARWARELGLSTGCLQKRLKRNLPLDQLFAPVRSRSKPRASAPCDLGHSDSFPQGLASAQSRTYTFIRTD